MKTKERTVVAGLLAATAMNVFAGGKAEKPNIIFILCDDMGYGDLACYGQRYIQTPHIDRLAQEGMRFTQAYAGSPVSAPSRASIMTGQHSGHGHVRGNKEYWPQSPVVKYGDNDEYSVVGQEPYDPRHVILPEVMKRNGYATGMFGKWAGGYEGSSSTPDKRGLDDNTIVIFSSDNGPHEEGGADPEFFGRDGKLRGLKRQCYEGGIRIPFIVRWPGKVEAGVVNDHQLAFYDIMPTFCELIGEKRFPRRYINMESAADCFDGISFAPTLLGNDAKQQTHDFLYWEFHETDQIGLRMGDWKLVVIKGVPHLYDLRQDIHEDHDIASSHQEVVRRMVDIIHREHRPSELFPVTLPTKQK